MTEEEIYSPRFIKALFNSLSNSYDKVNGIATFGLSTIIRKFFVGKLKPVNGQLEVVDLMSGLGENWKEIKSKFPEAHITAIDLSEAMTTSSGQLNSKHFSNNVLIITDNIFNIELRSNYYDMVVCSFGLKCLTATQISLLANMIQRILKKGGQFGLLDISKPKNKVVYQVFLLHFKYILPVIGSFFSGKVKGYQALWKYIDNFNQQEEVNELFKSWSSSFSCKRYFSGGITIITGIKT